MSRKLQLHRLVRSLPIPIATATYALVRATARRTIWLLNQFYPHKYTDADPYKCILVDPSSIEHTSGASRRRGWVEDGEWDENMDRFMQRTRPKAIEQHFDAGIDWNETVLTDIHDEVGLRRNADAIDQLYQQIREGDTSRNGSYSSNLLILPGTELMTQCIHWPMKSRSTLVVTDKYCGICAASIV